MYPKKGARLASARSVSDPHLDALVDRRMVRPGADYYKSEAEIKAIQTANKAAREAAKVQASLPSWQMLKGDWKVRTCLFCFVDFLCRNEVLHECIASLGTRLD